MHSSVFKRLFDIIFSASGLIICSPVFLILIILLSVVNKGEPFFFQRRPGKNGKIFSLIKFKTMTDIKDMDGEILADKFRLTKIGSVIRRASLDELPQLINVLKGEMSFVGPRPLLAEYLPLYTEEQRKRHNVKPGITGWAQVNGRNALSWKEKFEYDIWYVENISLKLDFKILMKTIFAIFSSKGITSRSSVTMEKFIGN